MDGYILYLVSLFLKRYTRYIYKKIMVFSILKKKRTKLTILSKKDAQDSEFCLFLGRIEETINCFWDGKNCGYYYDLKNKVQSRGP
jgi:hypothetical protein